MSCAPLFDLNSLPKADRQRYGPGAFSQHALQARHSIENGSTCVMVANGMPWDNHVFQHEMHQMLVPELDNVLYQLITDLEDRGMLEDTLVIATPSIVSPSIASKPIVAAHRNGSSQKQPS